MNKENVVEQGSGLRKTILILAANPKMTTRLRLDEEVREIEEGLHRSKYRDRFAIHSKMAVRLRDFRRALLDYEPQIVHFCGHGEKEGLFVEDELGFSTLFSVKALADLFKLCSGHVECVLLNACYTEIQARAINKHIDYVVGMRKDIKDKASIEFAVGFYDALGAGRSVENAFEFGRNAVLTEYPGLSEHLIPVLKKKKNVSSVLPPNIQKEMVNIRIHHETKGEIIDTLVPLDARTSVVKNLLIKKLELPKNFAEGRPFYYSLNSKTRNRIMDDDKTLRENDVQGNEVFTLLLNQMATLAPPVIYKTALQAHNGKYVSAARSSGKLAAEGDRIKEPEIFDVIEVDGRIKPITGNT